MKDCFILTTPALHFAKKISGDNFNIVIPDLNREKMRYFPDGEIYARLSKVNDLKNKRAVVLHSGAPKPNDGLIELELILQILKNNNITPEIFFSYFPYGRQDKVFEEGETNAAENLINKLTSYYNAEKIYIVEAHFFEREWVKNYPISCISAIPFLMEKVKEDFGKDVVFLATDNGGKRRFKIDGFDKTRENSYEIKLEISEKLKDSIKGKNVCLVDDLVETGGTLLKAAVLSKKYGAKKVVCALTHALLKNGVEKIKKNFAEVYVTNTIEQPETPQIDITQLILEAIKRL